MTVAVTYPRLKDFLETVINNGVRRDIVDEYDEVGGGQFELAREIMLWIKHNDDALRQFLEIMLNDEPIRRKLLFSAMNRGKINICKVILYGGMNLDFLFKSPRISPLMYALGERRINYTLVSLLLRAGANPDDKGGRRESPLSFIIMRAYNHDGNFFKTAQLLMDYGATPERPNDKGKTVFDELKEHEADLDEDTYNRFLDIITVDTKEPEFY